MPLSPDQAREALRRINAWRLTPSAPVFCPACERPGLAITDRSARPHAEWYALSCAGCGMTETVGMALGSMPPGLDHD